MPTSEKPKKQPEFFYTRKGKREDADLHNPIVDDGDHAKAESVSRKAAKRAGLSDAEIDALFGTEPTKTKTLVKAWTALLRKP